MKRFIVMTLLVSCLVFLPVIAHASYVEPLTEDELYEILYGSEGVLASASNTSKTTVLEQYSSDYPGLVEYVIYSWHPYDNIPGLEFVHDGDNLELVVSIEAVPEGDDISYSVDTLRYNDGVWSKRGNTMRAAGPLAVGDAVAVLPDAQSDLVFSYGAKNSNSGNLVEIPVLNKDGTIFFPPGQTLAEAIVEGLAEMQEMTGGTMTTLTACGVGLVASLMGLKVFSKVLAPYLP